MSLAITTIDPLHGRMFICQNRECGKSFSKGRMGRDPLFCSKKCCKREKYLKNKEAYFMGITSRIRVSTDVRPDLKHGLKAIMTLVREPGFALITFKSGYSIVYANGKTYQHDSVEESINQAINDKSAA